MNGVIRSVKYVCVLLLPVLDASESNSWATVIHVDGIYGSHSDDFNSPPTYLAPNWSGIEAAAYETPPSIDLSPANLYGRSGDGRASLFLMDEPWGEGNLPLRVEFDWVYLGGIRLTVTTSGRFESYTNSRLFSQLPPAPPEYVSIPETKRFSFDMSLSRGGLYTDISMNFLSTNALEEPVSVGLDNFRVWVVPEPATRLLLLLTALLIPSHRLRQETERLLLSVAGKTK